MSKIDEGRSAAFRAGFDAGFAMTGEGHNAEYTSQKLEARRPHWYEEDRQLALEKWSNEKSPVALDAGRCAVCGWPLAATENDGCVRGNCSMRPLPERYYDPDRAAAESGG